MVSPGIPEDSVLGEGPAIEGLEGQANSREPPPEVSVRPSGVLGSHETCQGVIWGQLPRYTVEAGRPLAKLGVGRARRERTIIILVITIC